MLRHACTGPLEEAATTSARPSASRWVVKSPESSRRGGNPVDRRFVKLAQPVVEQRHRRAAVGCQHEVEVAIVVDVEHGDPGVARAPPRSASAPGQGTSAIDSPAST